MKSFVEIIQEESKESKLDKLGHSVKLSADRLKQLKKDYSEFKHINLEDWQQYPFPKNSSEKTKKEIQHLISLGQFRTQWEDEMVEYDIKVIRPFKEYLDEYGIEVDFTRIKSLRDQSNPIILALKRHYNRPRPKALAKELGLPLNTFPLKTAGTPSYPSGHATQGRLVSLLVADEAPLEHRKNILDIGKRIGHSRQIAGAHYPTDTEFGIRLADHLYDLSKKGMEPDLKLESFELKEEDVFISINDTLPKSPTARTQIYEGCAIVEGMGKGLSILSHQEFSPICKSWIEEFTSNVDNGEKIMLDYCKELGGSMRQLGSFKDFIHNSVGDYYDNAPEIFEVPNPDKVNTADAVMISKGTRSDLFRIMKEMKGLDLQAQHRRIKTDTKSKITLLDSNDKSVVEFYQVSLKKDAKVGAARIGKVGMFANARFMTGIAGNMPTKIQTIQQNHLEWDTEAELISEGISDIFNKGTAVLAKLGAKVSKGVDFLYKKIKGVFSKLAKSANQAAKSFTDKQVKSNKIGKSANSIVKELQSQGGVITEGTRTIKANKPLVREIKAFNKAMTGDPINKLHQENKKLIKKLNSQFAVKDRPIEPIVVIEGGDVKISSSDLKKLRELDSVKEGDEVVLGLGTSMDTVFKLTSNWSGMNYIKGILKYVESKMSSYENLSTSLFALAAEFEGEARFGNTALPLVIVYGGNKLKHMGTRDDFEKKKVEDLAKIGKEYNDFPVLVIKIMKVSGKEYNSINVLLVESLDGMPPEPQWNVVGIATSSGSGFATKFEINTTTKNWKGSLK